VAQCDFCGKSKLFGRSIQHRHSTKWAMRAPKTNRAFHPNVHKTKVTAGQVVGLAKRRELFDPALQKAKKLPEHVMISAHICTRCLRTMQKA
jgi:ribosomal protein L28